jgi:hypothetical protein
MQKVWTLMLTSQISPSILRQLAATGRPLSTFLAIEISSPYFARRLGRDVLFLIFFLGSLVGPVSLVAAQPIGSVKEMYDDATSQIRKQNYLGAKKILRGLIRQYPSYEPAYVLLGRLYYRESDFAMAYRIFKRVVPEGLDAEAAIEYGVVAFARNDCGRALRGFRLMKADHELYDEANLYAAICSMRARNYGKAQSYAKRANNLTGDLASTRRKILQLAKERIAKESGGIAQQQPPSFQVAPPGVIGWDPLPPEPGEARPNSKKTRKTRESKAHFSISPSLDFSNKNSDVDYGGSRVASSTSTSIVGALKGLGSYTLNSTPFGEHPNLELGIDVSETRLSNSSNDLKYYVTPEGIVAAEAVPPVPFSPLTFAAGLKPAATFPLTPDLDLVVKYAYQEVWPDNTRSKYFAGSEPSAGVNFTKSGIAGNASGKYRQEFSQSSSKHTMTLAGGVGALVKELDIAANGSFATRESDDENSLGKDEWSDETILAAKVGTDFDPYSLEAEVSHRALTPANGQVGIDRSPLSKESGAATASANFDFGLGLTLKAAYATFTNYARLGIVTQKVDGGEGDIKGDVYANGNEFLYNANAKYSPIGWLALQANYQVVESTYTIDDQSLAPYFFQVVPGYTSTFTFSLSVSGTF